MDLDIGQGLKRGWEGFLANAAPLIVGAIAYLAVIMVSLGLLAGPMTIGFYRMCLKAARGETVEIGDVFSGLSNFVPSFVLMLIMGLGIAIGTMLCIVPGLYLAILWFWAPFRMADGNLDPMSCLNESSEYSKANLGPVAGFAIVDYFVNAIGSAIGGVGSLVSMPVAGVMAAAGHDQVFGGSGRGRMLGQGIETGSVIH